jgi:DUF4097 and DUF4098 domain-containing protein YvlB
MIETILLTMLLLEKSESGPAQPVEVRTSNATVEITGVEGDRVVVSEPARATVSNRDGRTVVIVEEPNRSGPLRVQVPRSSPLDIRTSNGGIRVSGVAGDLRLVTSNGSITVRNSSGAAVHAFTSNGPIEIGVPPGLNANLSARTSNGRIRSDIEITATQIGENYLNGKIGSGGLPIELQTSNGPIRLMRAQDQESVTSTFRSGEVK